MPKAYPSPRLLLGVAALLAASLVLSSCGGGGGGGSTAYNGPTTPATLTVANHQSFFNTVWNASQVAEEGGFHKPTPTAQAGMFSQLKQLINDAASPAPILGKITESVTNTGALGGSRTVIFNILDQVDGTGALVLDNNGNPIGVGTILATFNAYNNTGVTFNGEMLVNVSAYDLVNKHLTTGSASFTNLSADSASGGYQISGTVDSSMLPNFNGLFIIESLMFNLDGRDQSTGTNFRMQELSLFAIYDATAPQCRTQLALGGTMMVAPFGAVTINTTTNLLYGPTSCDTAHPTSGGPLVLTGANGANGPATITMTPVDATNLTLAVDVDGDGTPEQSANQPWGAF